MRKIGIRQFQQNFHKELIDVPFVVTKNGEDYRVVTSRIGNVTTPMQSINKTKQEKIKVLTQTIQSVDKSLNKENHDCEFPRAFCHSETQQYKATIYEEQGEVTKQMSLCDKHRDAMRKNGVELEVI